MANRGRQAGNGRPTSGAGRELICFTVPDSGVQVSTTRAWSDQGMDLGPLAQMAAEPDIVFRPVFGSADRLKTAAMDRPGAEAMSSAEVDALVADMSRCYQVEAPDERLEELAEQLSRSAAVESAYVKPAVELATVTPTQRRARAASKPKAGPTKNRETAEDQPHRAVDAAEGLLNRMQPDAQEAPAVTPSFVARQDYLDAAPVGIDARYAWRRPGGRGAGVRVIDCEWNWRFNHEDLRLNQGGVVVGSAFSDDNHGTAVLGEISGDVNAYGITGIAPDATVFGAAFSLPTAQVIQQAADRLSAGDIILLEIHRQGPGASGVGQDGYIAIEWWPDDYLAIRYASNRGVIVVEAAGNGARNLDDPIYDTRPTGFPTWWTNPFRRSHLDSGAVICGAGAPPPGTHGRDHGPDRSRLGFSNHGACVDAQGWGREVTSTGYGDLQGGGVSRDVWYTDQFSGTSSASPIVVGALACVQGVLRAHGRVVLSPGRARQLLRAHGSPQQDAPGRPRSQRIGSRPNLRQLIPAALAQGSWFGVQFRGRLEANQNQRWFTHSWPAHWHVVWSVLPTNPAGGGPKLEWTVRTERTSDYHVTYWIDIKNLTGDQVYFEARYAVLGW